LEVAQQIANHESPRTTKLYDRRQDEISSMRLSGLRSDRMIRCSAIDGDLPSLFAALVSRHWVKSILRVRRNAGSGP
jgi:hypothetical protein